MTEASPDQLREVVESQHGGTATFVQAVPIREMEGQQLIWQGTVHIFDLAGHPSASRAYAWSSEFSTGQRRMFAILHAGSVAGPREAVRSHMMADARAGK